MIIFFSINCIQFAMMIEVGIKKEINSEPFLFLTKKTNKIAIARCTNNNTQLLLNLLLTDRIFVVLTIIEIAENIMKSIKNNP